MINIWFVMFVLGTSLFTDSYARPGASQESRLAKTASEDFHCHRRKMIENTG
jgi:hypothetical protein